MNIESVGKKLHGFWYAFGAHDGCNLWEAPDNVSMAAVAPAISGGGALSSLETTVLLTFDETMDALRKGQASPVPSARRVAAYDPSPALSARRSVGAADSDSTRRDPGHLLRSLRHYWTPAA